MGGAEHHVHIYLHIDVDGKSSSVAEVGEDGKFSVKIRDINSLPRPVFKPITNDEVLIDLDDVPVPQVEFGDEVNT